MTSSLWEASRNDDEVFTSSSEEKEVSKVAVLSREEAFCDAERLVKNSSLEFCDEKEELRWEEETLSELDQLVRFLLSKKENDENEDEFCDNEQEFPTKQYKTIGKNRKSHTNLVSMDGNFFVWPRAVSESVRVVVFDPKSNGKGRQWKKTKRNTF